MLYRFSALSLVAILMVSVLAACSSTIDPASPQVTDNSRAANLTSHINWGTWDVTIDPETGQVETVPLRTAEFNANVVRFLQPPIAPIQLLAMQIDPLETDLMNGVVSMDVTVRHPFPGATKFRGFDVRGIIHLSGAATGEYDPGVSIPSFETTRVVNPDGYTRWWNQVEFTSYGFIFGYTEGNYAHPGFTSTATVNPYKIFTPSLEPTQPFYQMDLSQRATFPAIDGYATRRYVIEFDMTQTPPFGFKYSIDASWSLPDDAYKPDFPVEAFDERANCQEPYMIKVEEYEEIPYYVDEYVSGGDLQFLITIGDWQATGGNVLDEISHVWIESPTMMEAPVDVIGQLEFVESTHDTQATYRIYLEDMAPSGLDNQQLLITVESADPDSFAPQIPGDVSGWDFPDAPLAAYYVADVPITNLAPQGDYAYCYFLPDWCATMRYQCANDADNQTLLANIMSQNMDGYYNDYTNVQSWEGKTTSYVWGQNSDALHDTCTNLGYTFERTHNPYFDAGESRVVIAVVWSNINTPLNPPFTEEEAGDMQEFIDNGGILMFMCEATHNMHIQSLENIFGWLGMLMEYGGGATPELSDGYTSNITWHWLTEDVETYHYFTCGEWITQDPYVLTLVATEYDEKAVLMYPLPLE